MAREVQDKLVRRLGELLVERGFHLGLAESCTGGMLGDRITAISGASSYFLGGVITYDDRVKVRVLGVPRDVIAEKGAVSAECALAMARGAQQLLSSEVAVSITGVAGPGGGGQTDRSGRARPDPELVRLLHGRLRRRHVGIQLWPLRIAPPRSRRTGTR